MQSFLEVATPTTARYLDLVLLSSESEPPPRTKSISVTSVSKNRLYAVVASPESYANAVVPSVPPAKVSTSEATAKLLATE